MSLLIKGMEFPEIGEYKVFVFDDKPTKRRKIMIDKSYIDKHGMRVGNYSMYDFEEVVEPHGDLIDKQFLIERLNGLALLQLGERQRGTLRAIKLVNSFPVTIKKEDN